MKKISVRIPAKINLTLDVIGVERGFHNLKSLVASIDVFDRITVTKRNDKAITLTEKGKPCNCQIAYNNAFLAAKLFINTFDTDGVDIILEKDIPVGAGLGGSSADIAGVLNAMKTLFERESDTKYDVLPLAKELGSDSAYMLKGGYAVLEGRGDRVLPVDFSGELYLIIATENFSISARECYKAFDVRGKYRRPCTSSAVKALRLGDFPSFAAKLKNDLEAPAVKIAPKIAENINEMKKAGAKAALLTGSGSASYGVFFDKKSRDTAYKKLLPILGGSIIKAQTIIPER